MSHTHDPVHNADVRLRARLVGTLSRAIGARTRQVGAARRDRRPRVTVTQEANRTMARPRVLVGDVFGVPLIPGRFAVLQVVAKRNPGNFCFAVFDLLVDETGEAGDVRKHLTSENVVLLASSLDALIFHKRWLRLGSADLDTGVTPVAFRQCRQDADGREVKEIVSYDRQRSRPAYLDEWDRYRNEFTIAPIRLENAARAHFGYAEWEPEIFDVLRVGGTPTESEAFGTPDGARPRTPPG